MTLQEREEVLRIAASLPPSIPSFSQFFEKTVPFSIEPWQVRLGERLEKLRYQTGQRIRIHKPPQHGGSILLSQRLPAYLIGCNPSTAVRLVTYNETHSERFGRVVRDIIRGDEFRKMFPSPDVAIPQNASASEWSTAKRATFADARPSFKGLGLQTGIVGTGGNLWIIDDPYKSREEAFSETINEKIWWTWKEDIAVRLAPDDNVIVMYHSYSERDFSARLKEEGGWEEIRIPAICDEPDDFCGREIGEALSPRYPIEYLERVRDGYIDEDGKQVLGIGDATFESLYQGNPKPRGGLRFKEEEFRYEDEYPHDGGVFVLYIDLASSSNPKADRTAGTLVYRSRSDRFYVIDHWADRWEPAERNNFIRNKCIEYKEAFSGVAQLKFFCEETPGAGKEVFASLNRYCIAKGINLMSDKPTKDKVTRAGADMDLSVTDSILGQMKHENVFFVKSDRWNKQLRELKDECLVFPQGAHDDRVDSLVGAFNMATKQIFY